jgi:hypothetical protein
MSSQIHQKCESNVIDMKGQVSAFQASDEQFNMTNNFKVKVIVMPPARESLYTWDFGSTFAYMTSSDEWSDNPSDDEIELLCVVRPNGGRLYEGYINKTGNGPHHFPTQSSFPASQSRLIVLVGPPVNGRGANAGGWDVGLVTMYYVKPEYDMMNHTIMLPNYKVKGGWRDGSYIYEGYVNDKADMC